jgi:hypothetical protein
LFGALLTIIVKLEYTIYVTRTNPAIQTLYISLLHCPVYRNGSQSPVCPELKLTRSEGVPLSEYEDYPPGKENKGEMIGGKERPVNRASSCSTGKSESIDHGLQPGQLDEAGPDNRSAKESDSYP